MPSVVRVLLQHGVDPNARDGWIFASAIATQNPALVRLLLRARNKVSNSSLTRNLPIAVSQEQTEIVSLLVVYGADTKFENASALRKAVQAQRIDLVLAIIKGGVDGRVATSVMGEAFSSRSSLTTPEQYLLVEILLCAGAEGDPVAQTLVQVVRAGHRKIVELLVMHGANLDYNNAEALRIAVTTENVDVLSTLALGSIPKVVASDMIDIIPPSCCEDQTYEMLSLLIGKGAKGRPLHRALVRAVKLKSNRIVGLLLDHKASVDFEESQALRIAVTEGDLAIFNLLLSKGRPQPNSMQFLLTGVPPSPPQVRCDMIKSIVNTAGHDGIPTRALNEALLQSVESPSGEVDKVLVEFLITAGAKVDCERGKCFRLAAERGSIELLELLIPNLTEPTSLSAAIAVSMRITDSKRRRRFFGILLNHGAKGQEVDQAFVHAIEEKPNDEVLVQLLLEKADVQYSGGRALSAAVRCSHSKLVAVILNTHRTDQQSRIAAGSFLFESGMHDRQTKMRLLLEEGVGQEGLDDALIREIGGEKNADIVKMLLDYKASCEYNNGKSMELAIRSLDHRLLGQLVASHPDHRILETLMPVAMSIKNAASRRTCLALLLRGGSQGNQVSEALAQEVESLDRRDPSLIQLLVQHGARIDYSNGRAIKHVVSQYVDIKLLKILLSGSEASAVLPSLVPLAMAHEQGFRLQLLEVLLENNARCDNIHAALVTAVAEGFKARPTIDLLLKHGASVNFKEAEAVKVAARAGNYTILECLLSKNPDPKYYSEEALSLAMKSSTAARSKSHRLGRLHSVRLLTRTKGTQPEAIHSALCHAVQEKDYDLIEHLMKSGGDPNFEKGKSVVTATNQLDIRSLYLLARFKPTPEVYSYAFVVMPQSIDRWCQQSKLIHEFDTVLVQGGATGAAVDQTFLSALRSSHRLAATFVSMVLSCKTALNANFEGGKSLCTAVRKADFEVLDYMLSQAPNDLTLRTAFIAIFDSEKEERTLILLAKRFFEHSQRAKHIYFRPDELSDDPLYQTLHRHGDKPDLLQTLFANGCGTESRFSWIFRQKIGPEPTSALLWLLCQGDEGVHSRTVKLLLDRGGWFPFHALCLSLAMF